jgi:hypothetical protein
MTDGAKATKTRATSPKTATRTAQRRQPSRAGKAEEHGVDVPVPVFSPHMKVVHLPTPPGMGYLGDAGRVVAGYLPPPERLAFYGGLGLAAVAGILDWPVAAAIGIGTMIARRGKEPRRAERPGQQSGSAGR